MIARKVISLCKSKYTRLYSSPSLPDIDVGYYCDVKNLSEVKQNISLRKGVGNLDRVLNIYNSLQAKDVSENSREVLEQEFYKELSKLPNKTHPLVQDYKDEPRLVHELNEKREFGKHTALEFSEITRLMNLMRTDKLGPTCGHKSYYFLGELAELEEALIKYAITFLMKENFKLISVPDILPKNILESCGMSINNDRTQIYSLDPIHHGPDLYLSGTAEMSLAGLLMNSEHSKNDLPLKLAAVSRCFRAETSNVIEERGVYRVHQFTKVEMFAVTTPEQSEEMLEYIRSLQEKLFLPLHFNMRVLDMPPHELGAPAYRKYDIEAWMPGRANYGEISSCSNCTDYQSRRLNITFNDNNTTKYVHTLNGTACAIPRLLITLLETHQEPKGKIFIPHILQPFMKGKKYITKNSAVPDLKLMKLKK